MCAYSLILPPALPAQRPRTFVVPQPTKAMLEKRHAEAERREDLMRRGKSVPLSIRFLRALGSRRSQHTATTTTLFHRILKRRRSLVNRHFISYKDEYPVMEARLKAEMAGTDVIIQVVLRPQFFMLPRPLADCVIQWSTFALSDSKSSVNSNDAAEEDDQDDDNDDSDEQAAHGPTILDINELVKSTRDAIDAETQAAELNDEDEILQSDSKGTKNLTDSNVDSGNEKRHQHTDGAATILLIPRDALQDRGRSYSVVYDITHIPSGRHARGSTKLSVAPKNSVWKVELEKFDDFIDEDTIVSQSDEEEDDEGNESVPDPFADVNQPSEEPSSRSIVIPNPHKNLPTRVVGQRIKRGPFESDEDWLKRLEGELDFAKEERDTARLKRLSDRAYRLQTTEEALTVFDSDARKVSLFTQQFLAQEIADEKLAVSKLQTRWYGPAMNDFEGSKLNLSGKALERDDLDALAWILRRNWGIQTLDLSRCAIDDVEVERLFAALRLNVVLTHLDLRRTRLSDTGAALCIAACSAKRGSCLRLRKLDLRGCRKMTRVAGMHFHRAVDNPNLTLEFLCGLDLKHMENTQDVLDLTGTALGLPEIEFIARRYIRPQPPVRGWGGKKILGLEHLILPDTGLTSEGVCILCDTLKKDVAIQSLDVSNNPIYRDGARAIAQLAQTTLSLRIIRMRGCHTQWTPEMVEEEARRRAAGLKSKRGKQTQIKAGMDFQASYPPNDYDPSALYILADVAKRRKQLEVVELSDEDLESIPAQEIERSLSINRAVNYRQHIDLAEKVIPAFPKLKSHQMYELTLDVDSRFLINEKLLQMRSIAIRLSDKSRRRPFAPESTGDVSASPIIDGPSDDWFFI